MDLKNIDQGDMEALDILVKMAGLAKVNNFVAKVNRQLMAANALDARKAREKAAEAERAIALAAEASRKAAEKAAKKAGQSKGGANGAARSPAAAN